MRRSFYEQMKEVDPTIDPTRHYTPRQLDLIATKILFDERVSMEQEGRPDDGPMWLHEWQLRGRRFKEVYNEYGIPEPEKFSGIFRRAWRPQRRTQDGTDQDHRDY